MWGVSLLACLIGSMQQHLKNSVSGRSRVRCFCAMAAIVNGVVSALRNYSRKQTSVALLKYGEYAHSQTLELCKCQH